MKISLYLALLSGFFSVNCLFICIAIFHSILSVFVFFFLICGSSCFLFFPYQHSRNMLHKLYYIDNLYQSHFRTLLKLWFLVPTPRNLYFNKFTWCFLCKINYEIQWNLFFSKTTTLWLWDSKRKEAKKQCKMLRYTKIKLMCNLSQWMNYHSHKLEKVFFPHLL